MKNRKNKFLALGLGVVLGLSCVFSSYATSADLKDAKKKVSSLQEEKKKVQDTLKQLEGLKSDAAAYVKELDKKLTSLDSELSQLEKDISAKEDQIENTKAELEEAKAVEKEQYASMKLRIQYMYENSSGNGYMAMLFSSKSISELISRAEYIQKISDFDRDLMQEYEDTVDQVKEKETQVQEEQAAIVELQQQSSDQQEAIQELYAAAYQELRTYSAELDDAKSSESALVDEINSKADAINDLIRQAKEEEIAAQKKAEEEAAAAQQAAAEAEAEAARKQAAEAEAARVAAAEAANAAAKADTDTSSSSGSSSSDSSASSTTTGSPSASDTSSSSSSGTYLGRFKLTGYCSCSICTGQWSGGSTASGTTPTAGRTIAMGGVPFGTKLMINGQVYTVEDRGTAYGHVDIFCSSHSEALSFGVQYADVYQLS